MLEHADIHKYCNINMFPLVSTVDGGGGVHAGGGRQGMDATVREAQQGAR